MDIRELFQKYYNKTASLAEREELLQQLSAVDESVLSDMITRAGGQLREADQELSKVKAEKILKEILGYEDTSTQLGVEEYQIPLRRVHILRTVWFRYAAAVIIILGIGAYFWNIQTKEKPSVTQINPVPVQNDVAPGGNRATLTLADGSKIILDSAANGKIAQQDNTSITKNGDQILYSSPVSRLPSAGSRLTYNTMATPRRGQYQLTLPDGSKVWLNAASSITYPTAFTGKERKVSITGEVYFEVAKDNTKPFIVKTRKDEISVLGTQFNINTYEDESAIKTSLLEGSVKIADKILKPGQAYINGEIVPTNTEQDIAWKNGVFNFNDVTLQEAMRQLSRWYDVEIVYEGKVPGITFVGKIGRDLKLSQVLKGLEVMGVKFRIEGKKLIVTQ